LYFCSVADINVFWLRASDIGRTPHGQFQWEEDGSIVDESAWRSGYPENEGKETCVYYLTQASAVLYNNDCSMKLSLLCELPEMLSSCFDDYEEPPEQQLIQ
jgi:hypothetical protein